MGQSFRKKRKKVPIPHKEYQFTIKTDGACIGNPGKTGIGGNIRNNETQEVVSSFSESLGTGTNNEAEYKAVIHALELVKDLKPTSVLLCADSQLVIYQLTGIYGIRDVRMNRLYTKAKNLIRELDCHVEFMWIPRHQNSEADALASKAAGMPMAVVSEETGEIKFWTPDPNYIPDSVAIEGLPVPKEECQKGIERINKMGDSAKFRDFGSLKTGGIDKYSRMNMETMLSTVKVRFGDSAVQWLLDTIGETTEDYSKSVFKWVARGLRPDLALKKVSVDAEIASNALKKLTAYQ